MRLWPFGKRDLVPERKYSAVGPNIARMYVGQAVWSARDYASFAREGYQQNAIAFRAIKLVAQSAAGVPLVLYNRRGEEIEEHPLLDLLARPCGAYSRAEFFEAAFAYLLIAGNSYIEAVGPERGEPKELWPLRPDRMQIIPGRYGFPEGYRYTVNGMPKDWRANPMTGAGPILHIKDFNPLDDWYGMSRIEAAAYGIDRHNAASAHNKALLDNGARPSGALVFKPVKLEDGTYSSAPQAMLDAAKSKLIEGNSGPENAGKPMVFTGDVAWEEMGISPKDMDFGEGKNDAARDLLAALGVPAMLLVPGESTYSNRAEANLEFYERTVIPLVEQLVGGLNAWLCPRFGDGMRFGIDFDGVSALEPRREGRRQAARELFNDGVIDLNEARAMLQYGEAGADFIEKPDPQIITSLTSEAIYNIAGDEPIYGYLLRTGLLAKGTTIERFRQSAEDFLSWGHDDDVANDMALSDDTKSEKKTIYVHRPLLNADEVVEWAKGQGFTVTLPADDMHVTLAFSKRPVDWSKVKPETKELIVKPSKRRMVEPLGDKGAVVLRFSNDDLSTRWSAFKAAGATWDFPSYKPHVTITYQGDGVDLDAVEAYPGALRFGGEIFAEIDDDWADNIQESE